jgi:hypothetical protein
MSIVSGDLELLRDDILIIAEKIKVCLRLSVFGWKLGMLMIA